MSYNPENKCSVHGCEKKATVSCGTWSFCTKHAIGVAHVQVDEDGYGIGLWGTASATPKATLVIREMGGKLMKLEEVEV